MSVPGDRARHRRRTFPQVLKASQGRCDSRPKRRGVAVSATATSDWNLDLVRSALRPRCSRDGALRNSWLHISRHHTPASQLLAFGRAIRQNRNWNTQNTYVTRLELQTYPKEITLKTAPTAGCARCAKTMRRIFTTFSSRCRNQNDVHQASGHTTGSDSRMVSKHRPGRNLPLLALMDGKIVGAVTLHQQLGGWKRHIGRVSVFVLPVYRAGGLARALIGEIVQLARNVG